MIDIHTLILRLYTRAKERPDLDCNPYGDIAWAEALQEPRNADEFALEIIFVICNSGMRYTTARTIYEKVVSELRRKDGGSAWAVFRHTGKAAAIDAIWKMRRQTFRKYRASQDKLAFIAGLPWIGNITKYHVAKNFGLPYAKPDVHLQRLADALKTTPQRLCEQLAEASGYSVATVDTLLWRAAAVGVLDTSTGAIRP